MSDDKAKAAYHDSETFAEHRLPAWKERAVPRDGSKTGYIEYIEIDGEPVQVFSKGDFRKIQDQKSASSVEKGKDAIGDLGWWLLDLLVFVISFMAVTYFFSWWIIAPNLIDLGVLDEGTSWVTVASTVGVFALVQAFVISLFQMSPLKNRTPK